MYATKGKRALSLFLTLLMLAGSLSVLMTGVSADDVIEAEAAAPEESEADTSGEEIDGIITTPIEPATDDEQSFEDYLYSSNRSLEEIERLINTENYSEYSKRYADVPAATETVTIEGAEYDADNTTADVEVYTDYEDMPGDSLYIPEKGQVSWTFSVPDTAKYAMRITYYNAQGTNTTIERMMFVDNKLLFAEARYIYLPRTWVYEYKEGGRFDIDINGNDIRPIRTELFRWSTYFLRDWLGYSQNPFQMYLTEGEHTITLEGAREPIVIKSIEFYPYIEEPTYADRLAEWKAAGAEVVSGVEPIRVQCDEPSYVSNQNMFPANDRTSCLTEPQSPTKITYNILDFGTPNQYAAYDVTVPKAGLYKIAVRFRQNSLIGLFTSRRVYVNGEIPFREAGYFRFIFDTAFQVMTLSTSDGEDVYFYLNEGKNTITFEAVLGDMSEFVTQVETMISDLTYAYQKILMITGPSPDTQRDYGFARLVPDCLLTLAKYGAQLYDIVDRLVEITGEKGDQVATLETYAMLFKKMAVDEYEIPNNMSNFKSYIVSLSNWLYSILSQPVKMDYFEIMDEDTAEPAAVADFFQTAWFEMRAFIGSFFMDYTTIGFAADAEDGVNNTGKTLTMWATSDRETSLILRRIIDSNYTPQTGTTVTIKVISAGLQEAIIAGIGPDVSQMTTTDAITWGLRTAVEKLNDFEGFDECIAEFPDVVMNTLSLYGDTYGLPTSITMNAMFYRVDVLAELGIEIPRTWDELYSVMSVIQNKKLQVGLPTSLEGLKIFLYQNGVELFADDGKKINLDSNEALSAFESLTNFFTKYDSPVAWESSRFRTGEIPIMIGDAVSKYNELMGYVDIRGLWEMAPLLGTVQDDGSINYTSVITTAPILIPRGADDPEVSWSYIKWYVSHATQTALIKETIAVSGPTTKVSTPNVEALLAQPWTDKEYNTISFQIQHLASIPEYPGIYIVSQYVNSAFQAVYSEHGDPSEEMLDRIMDINKEITRKRREFGMEAYDLNY